MNTEPVDTRSATAADLDAVNRVVEAAVLTWDLPARVKRLALPSYRYHAQDLEHLDITVAIRDGEIVGVLACEPAEARDAPPGRRALLVHGLYVHPNWQRHGIGGRLLDEAESLARERAFDGLLIRAQAGAEAYFEKRGFQRLPVADPRRDYGARFWFPVT